MAASYSFRKALNGFHREDVVRHLEYINTRHANQVNQLKADLEAREQEIQRLRKLEGLQDQLAQLQNYCADLEREKQDYEDRIALLQTRLEEEQNHQAAIVSRTEEELEAYRRAERLERQAQQRAEQLCDKANAIISETGARVDTTAQRIAQLSSQVANNLEQLRSEILSSKDALADASAALETLRPEEM